MIKTILAQVREYRLSTVLAPLFTVGEVVLEMLIPFVTASIIDKGIQAGNIQQVYLYGGLMLIMDGWTPRMRSASPRPGWPGRMGLSAVCPMAIRRC